MLEKKEEGKKVHSYSYSLTTHQYMCGVNASQKIIIKYNVFICMCRKKCAKHLKKAKRWKKNQNRIKVHTTFNTYFHTGRSSILFFFLSLLPFHLYLHVSFPFLSVRILMHLMACFCFYWLLFLWILNFWKRKKHTHKYIEKSKFERRATKTDWFLNILP